MEMKSVVLIENVTLVRGLIQQTLFKSYRPEWGFTSE